MKVIMLKDVGGVGQRGAIKDVSDGYALNYLIPNGLAEQATPQKIDAHAKRQVEAAASNAAREKHWADAAKKIEGAVIDITVRANAQGHLYNQLSTELVRAEIKKVFGVDVPPDAVLLNAPVREVGEREIVIRMGTSSARVRMIVKSAA